MLNFHITWPKQRQHQVWIIQFMRFNRSDWRSIRFSCSSSGTHRWQDTNWCLFNSRILCCYLLYFPSFWLQMSKPGLILTSHFPYSCSQCLLSQYAQQLAVLTFHWLHKPNKHLSHCLYTFEFNEDNVFPLFHSLLSFLIFLWNSFMLTWITHFPHILLFFTKSNQPPQPSKCQLDSLLFPPELLCYIQ